MKHIVSLSILMAAPGTALNADWKIVTRTGDTSIAEYFKGALVRADSPPAFTSVSDFDHRRNVNWRIEALLAVAKLHHSRISGSRPLARSTSSNHKRNSDT